MGWVNAVARKDRHYKQEVRSCRWTLHIPLSAPVPHAGKRQQIYPLSPLRLDAPSAMTFTLTPSHSSSRLHRRRTQRSIVSLAGLVQCSRAS